MPLGGAGQRRSKRRKAKLESSINAQDGEAHSSSSTEEVPMRMTRRQKRLAETTAESLPRWQRQGARSEVRPPPCCPKLRASVRSSFGALCCL